MIHCPCYGEQLFVVCSMCGSVRQLPASNGRLQFLIHTTFCICCINHVKLTLQVGALIITPTRELAVQIDEVLSHFLQHIDNKFTHMLFIGGNNPAGDVERFLQHGSVHSA